MLHGATAHSRQEGVIRGNHIHTVTELTTRLKGLIEDAFPMVWLSGEVSNFRIPASGHHYFVVKDENAQISAVMFQRQNQNLTFIPENGMSVTGFGRVSVYDARGTYQIIFEYLEPRGLGALYAAFEQLKKKLRQEGLFDEARKRALPFLPRKIGVVTSGSGAVVHDIIQVLSRRFANVHLVIRPTKVQGDGAENEIIQALTDLQDVGRIDLIILARGGGSVEDLHAFNAESVARAIHACPIPIISGVGHETDTTIADFVADVRAPTPSAAAELAVPLKADLLMRCNELHALLAAGMKRHLARIGERLVDQRMRILHPGRRLLDAQLKVDDYRNRITRIAGTLAQRQAERLRWQVTRLMDNSPMRAVTNAAERIRRVEERLWMVIRRVIERKKGAVQNNQAHLSGLNPLLVLKRGYSIVLSVPDGRIVRDARMVTVGDALQVRLAQGRIDCRVERIRDNDSKKDI